MPVIYPVFKAIAGKVTKALGIRKADKKKDDKIDRIKRIDKTKVVNRAGRDAALERVKAKKDKLKRAAIAGVGGAAAAGIVAPHILARGEDIFPPPQLRDQEVLHGWIDGFVKDIKDWIDQILTVPRVILLAIIIGVIITILILIQRR